MKFSVYIACLSVFILSNLKLHKTLAVENIFIQEKSMLRLTFNPGLALTGFRTTRPYRKYPPLENCAVNVVKRRKTSIRSGTSTVHHDQSLWRASTMPHSKQAAYSQPNKHNSSTNTAISINDQFWAGFLEGTINEGPPVVWGNKGTGSFISREQGIF